MTEFTDQHLSAYIDGELSEELTRAIREALSHDADLADRLRALEHANERFLSAHRDIGEEPIPQFLLDTIRDAPATMEAEDNVVRLPARTSSVRAWMMPLAACLVLAIGIEFGTRLSPGSSPAASEAIFAGPVMPGSDLHRVLETVPSGEREHGLRAILSFASVDGGYCRELESSTTRAVACRAPDHEEWTVLASVAQESDLLTDAYVPASADPARAIEQVVDQIIVEIPLSSEAESSLIANQWKR